MFCSESVFNNCSYPKSPTFLPGYIALSRDGFSSKTYFSINTISGIILGVGIDLFLPLLKKWHIAIFSGWPLYNGKT